MNTLRQFLLLLGLALLTQAVKIEGAERICLTLRDAKVGADVIYHSGNIITMREESDRPMFVAVRNGIISAVGKSEEEMLENVGKNTRLINLHGRTLIPGLIDAHSHFSATATRLSQGFNIAPPPFGPASSIPALLDSIRNYIATNKIPAGRAITGGGYNDLDMVEGRHPTRYELDSVSTDHPIVLAHFSLHIVVANSLALQMINYTSADSSEGVIDTFPNGTITGVCREHATTPLFDQFFVSFSQLTPAQIQNTVDQYFSCGVTTTQDLITESLAEAYHRLGDEFPIDVNGYFRVTGPDISGLDRTLASFNTSRYKTRGVKFIIDGSIQGYTALLGQPYYVPEEKYSSDLTNYTYDASRSCSTENCGQDNFPVPTLLRTIFQTLIARNADIHVHCNGDVAAENMLTGIEWARNNTQSSNRPRVIMIHAQTVREDQLDRFAALDINPSFFPAHIYYWGDKHYNIFLGPRRANRMNPTGSALRRKIRFTLHNDSPVVLAGMFNGVNTFLKLMSAAVNRVTMGGRLLDDGTQKIPIYQALKGLTINSAWQCHEEKRKGSIEVGKVADFAILNNNPLEMQPADLDSLQVLVTVKEGRVVFGDYDKLRQ